MCKLLAGSGWRLRISSGQSCSPAASPHCCASQGASHLTLPRGGCLPANLGKPNLGQHPALLSAGIAQDPSRERRGCTGVCSGVCSGVCTGGCRGVCSGDISLHQKKEKKSSPEVLFIHGSLHWASPKRVRFVFFFFTAKVICEFVGRCNAEA